MSDSARDLGTSSEPPVRDSGLEPRVAAPEPSRTCPNCGGALFEQKCKLLCPNRACGYYLSCSDFY